MLHLNTIHEIDALEGLRQLADQSVDCVMTSPPYWSTRDYNVLESSWSDGSSCGLGLEVNANDYVRHLCEVFDEVKRVLKKTGTVWVNLGDTYAGSWGNNAPNGIKGVQRGRTVSGRRWNRPGYQGTTFRPPSSAKQGVRQKSLCLIPERFALGMVERGWILRNRVVWHKPNHMPASVKDRLTQTWEYLLFFVKQKRYLFDLDGIREPHKDPGRGKAESSPKPAPVRRSHHLKGRRLPPPVGQAQSLHPLGKNPGDCWNIATGSFRGAHVAVYPEQLCERPIKAGCPRHVCTTCGAATFTDQNRPACDCSGGVRGVPGVSPGVVLDPFMGSGTTAVVARRLGRSFIGFELNPEYVKLADRRLRTVRGSGFGATGSTIRHRGITKGGFK